jgi:hypothetical protein
VVFLLSIETTFCSPLFELSLQNVRFGGRAAVKGLRNG